MKLALKITPQRSTQYASMTEKLAAPELLASPLASAIQRVEPITLAGQNYLLVMLDVADHPLMATLSPSGICGGHSCARSIAHLRHLCR